MQGAMKEPLSIGSLLFCAKPRADAASLARLREFARSRPDWEELLATAAVHGLRPTLFGNLEACAADALDPSWRERFRSEFLRNSCRNLALTAELIHVLQALEKNGVRATPYKGPVLAVQAYGDVVMREFSDLDILLPQAQIAAAEETILSIGFSRVAPSLNAERAQIPGQYAYRKGAALAARALEETLVELHTEDTLRYFPQRLDLAELCARRQPVELAGRQVLTFCAEDTLLLLCVHGSKHFWERLGWIADLAALAQVPGRINWSSAIERARAWRIERMLLLGLGLAAELFDLHLPSYAIDCLKRDPVAQHLVSCVCKRLLAGEQADLGLFSRFAFRVRMRGSLLAGVLYAMRLTFKPTEEDRGRHARFLEPLYALRRPLRLARTYGWRTRTGS